MKNSNYAEGSKTGDEVVLGGWNPQVKTFPTVEIPLDEYKEFIEFQVKGPTVEMPLAQYEKMEEDNMCMHNKIWDLENHIRDLKDQLERAEELKREINRHTDIVTTNVAHEITEKVMKDLLQLSEEQKKELREKWRENVANSDMDNKGKRGDM